MDDALYTDDDLLGAADAGELWRVWPDGDALRMTREQVLALDPDTSPGEDWIAVRALSRTEALEIAQIYQAAPFAIDHWAALAR